MTDNRDSESRVSVSVSGSGDENEFNKEVLTLELLMV